MGVSQSKEAARGLDVTGGNVEGQAFGAVHGGCPGAGVNEWAVFGTSLRYLKSKFYDLFSSLNLVRRDSKKLKYKNKTALLSLTPQ